MRYSHHKNDFVLQVIQITYQETAAGWLPKSWTGEYHMTSDRSFLARDEREVVSFDVRPSIHASDFHMEPAAGMHVRDTRSGKVKMLSYKNKDQPPLDARVEWVQRHGAGTATDWQSIFVWASVASGGLALMFFGVRKFKSAAD